MDYQPLGSVEHDKIAKLIMRAACRGSWLLLDNLQLSLDIIPNLVKFLETMYECEQDVTAVLRSSVQAQLTEKKRKRWRFVSGDQDSSNSQTQKRAEDDFFKNSMRVAKQIAREKILQVLETNEKA